MIFNQGRIRPDLGISIRFAQVVSDFSVRSCRFDIFVSSSLTADGDRYAVGEHYIVILSKSLNQQS